MNKRSLFGIKRLTSTQQGLIVTIVLLTAAVLALLFIAYYSNLANVSAIQTGYTFVDLASIQQEVTRLHAETNRALRDMSINAGKPELQAESITEICISDTGPEKCSTFEKLKQQHDAISHNLREIKAKVPQNASVQPLLQAFEVALSEYTAQLQEVYTNPTPEGFQNSIPQFDSILWQMERQIQRAYMQEEELFFEDLNNALKYQRRYQALLLILSSTLILCSVVLVRSLGQSVSGEFDRTYQLLEKEVQERRKADRLLRQQNAYLSALHETSLALMNRLDLQDLLETIVSKAAALLNTQHGYVYLVEPDAGVIERKVGIGIFNDSSDFRLMPGEGLVGQVWQSSESLVINDYADWEGRPDLRSGSRLNAVMGAPLKSGSEVAGVIGLAYDLDSGRTFEENEIELLRGFAQLASIALDNAQLFAQAERRMRELEALYRANAELYSHLELKDVLRALVDVAVDILKADKSLLMVWDSHKQRLIAQAARGFKAETLAEMSLAPDDCLIGRVATTGEPIMVRDTLSKPDVTRQLVALEGIRSSIHVPLTIGEEVFGVFTVSYTHPYAFSEADQRLTLALAQRTALAIQNAKLYEQAQHAATVEERQRIARELHDAVTQTLFSASIIADVLPRLWELNPEEALHRVQELRELTRGAMAEMRTLLLELRPTALKETPIDDLLHQLGEATTGRARVPVHVSSIDGYDLPQDVKVALYRIAQEALNNVAKHAGATQAEVILRHLENSPGFELCIRDDGQGFNPKQVRKDHMGLHIMHERAEAIGATLTIRGQPDQGTHIIVRWQSSEAYA